MDKRALPMCHEFKQRLIQRQYSELEEEKDEYQVWMQSLKATLGILQERPWKLIIFKVPNRLRRLKQDAYHPCLVSIGPFHHGNSELLAMEERKWRYMLCLLHRTTDPEKTLEVCGREVSSLEESARGCYAENIRFSKNELAEILLLDACFILELFLRYSDVNFVDKTDPILNNAWMIPSIRYDLTLLENQIPFFILEKVFDIIEKSLGNFHPYALTEYALFFFHSLLNSSKGVNLKESCFNCNHLLDMLHKLYLPTSLKACTECKNTWGFKHCATKLSEAGVQFQRGNNTGNLLDVTFQEGLIIIPPLSLDERTEILLRNLIAFEQSQCSSIRTDHITSYALLMKSLIRSSQDVEFLQAKGIIMKNWLGENASAFFKSLCKEVVFRGFYFSELCDEVNVYRKSWLQGQRLIAMMKFRWHRYMAALRRDYFSNPWRIISFIAAIVLLILTALQTIYTIHAK